jgi:peptidoglycan/xylan/chitin deacetylase (PgdA/CDA1 family)
MHDELWRVEEAMIKILGLKPKYFRAPYGEYNDLTLQVLGERGYTSASSFTIRPIIPRGSIFEIPSG